MSNQNKVPKEPTFVSEEIIRPIIPASKAKIKRFIKTVKNLFANQFEGDKYMKKIISGILVILMILLGNMANFVEAAPAQTIEEMLYGKWTANVVQTGRYDLDIWTLNRDTFYYNIYDFNPTGTSKMLIRLYAPHPPKHPLMLVTVTYHADGDYYTAYVTDYLESGVGSSSIGHMWYKTYMLKQK